MANVLDVILTKETNFKYLLWTILTWTGINLLLNLVGLLVGELNEPSSFPFGFDEFLWISTNLFVQTVGFAITFFVSFALTQKRVLSLYMFPAAQFVIFHFILLSGMESNENGYQFISGMHDWDVRYLMANQQELIDLANIFYPTSGIFEDGMFIPEMVTFYSVWIAMTLIYFVLISWLTGVVVRKIRNSNTAIAM